MLDRPEAKYFVGVTTHNRLNYVTTMARSLSFTDGLAECEVRIFDDCSSDYDEMELRRLFPFANCIVRHDSNLGAGGNMKTVFEAFTSTTSDVVILADSDLLFHPSWLRVVQSCFDHTAGVLTLYNSVAHSELGALDVSGTTLVEKADIGAAGAVLSRPIVEGILSSVRIVDRSYDWRWCRYLNERHIPMYATKRSYVQHIGSQGLNADGLSVDIGRGFFPGNTFNEEAMICSYDQLFSRTWDALDKHILGTLERFKMNDLQYRLGTIPMTGYYMARSVLRFIRRLVALFHQ